MIKETLILARLARYVLRRAAEVEWEGRDAVKYRNAFHKIVQLFPRVMTGKISPEDMKPLLDFLDKSGMSAKMDGGSGSGNHGHKGRPGQQGGSAPKASAEGKNKPCTGFQNQSAVKRHKKHWTEFGVTSNADYEKLAIDFIKQPVGGKIDGYVTADGEVVRFNVDTGEYGKGVPGGRLVTYFKAKFKNGQVNLAEANNYFNHLKKEEGDQDA